MKHYYKLLVFAAVIFSNSAVAQNSAKFCDIKPAMRNERLEYEAIIWANRRANDLKCREVYKRAVIVSDKWELCTDEYRWVTGRKIHMVLYGETYYGACGMAHFIFFEKHEGRGYFSKKLKGEQTGDFYAVQCE